MKEKFNVPSILLTISFCVTLVSSQSFGNLDKGDKCHHEQKNLPGICILLNDCPSAVQLIKEEQIYPQICTFEKNIPVVCCTKTSKPELTTAKPQTESSSSASQTQRNPGDISKQKCKEYGKLVYKTVEIPSFGIGETVTYVEEADCSVRPTFVHNGEDSGSKEFPHMALLGYRDKHAIQWGCGGSLISEQYVLTAAHCLSSQELGVVRWARLGDLDISQTNDDASPQEFEVIKRIRHPDYKRPSTYNDIALLYLDRPVEFTDYVRPACLHTTNDIPSRYLVTGWGYLDHDVKQLSNVLQKGIIESFTNSECNTKYHGYTGSRRLKEGVQESTQICAGGKQNDTDTCPSDSGGPLQINHPDVFCMYSIVGITSFGQPRCGVKGIPAIYARVAPYVKWIEDTVWP